jgi:hypothetical protein
MLDCCKSDSSDRKNASLLQTPTTQYKYSFRQRSHIPIYPFPVADSRKLSADESQLVTIKNREH